MIPILPSATPRPSSTIQEASGPPATPRGGTRVNWIGALGLGLLAALGSGVAWGAIAAATGYTFGLAAVFIGFVVSYAIARGAARITLAVIVLSVVLTTLAIFLGDVFGLTLLLMREGFVVGFLDVLVAYPEILALAPLDAVIVYVFGLLGAAYGANRLYRQMKAQAAREHPSWAAPPAAAMMPPAEQPKVEVLDQAATRAAVRITVPMAPAHVVEATFESLLGTATVQLDGREFDKSHVLGREKIVQVPLEGNPSRMLNLRFWGGVRPRIDIRLDAVLVGAV